MCSTPTMMAMAMECLKVKRKISDSRPTMPVEPVATEMDCGEIILPQTPQQKVADMVMNGSIPIFSAVTACSLPNRALVEVSEPVMNTPSQPSNAAKKGKAAPVVATA